MEVPASLAEKGASHVPVTGGAEVSSKNLQHPIKH